jgi:nitrogen fixation protein NifU and related proteins
LERGLLSAREAWRRITMDWADRLADKVEGLLSDRAKERQASTQQTSPQMSGPVLYYTETLIDHFANPRNVGEMAADEADGYALIGDPQCGDQMKLWIQVRDGCIADIRFRSFGCPGAIATSSMTTELALGKTVEEALNFCDDDVVDALGGVPENKRHCSLLGVNALHAALVDYMERVSGAEPEPPAAT